MTASDAEHSRPTGLTENVRSAASAIDRLVARTAEKNSLIRSLSFLFTFFVVVTCARANDLAVDLGKEMRRNFRNPDGSCVQCSLGMCGVDQNVPAASTLLWRSRYGPAERGGSGPSRVARYSRERGIKIYNITGSPTFAWMDWETRNGRGAAIGAGRSHFQTLMGHSGRRYYVCNNNSTHRIDEYSPAGFSKLHRSSGLRCVILDAPPHPARPKYRRYW